MAESRRTAMTAVAVDAARTHPAVRLLAAENAPLIVSFLDLVFITPNCRSMQGPDLIAALDAYLDALRAEADNDDLYPRAASSYLADWSRPTTGWLRRSYPPGQDVPQYEPTPAAEATVAFLRSLERREFVGTASRLLTVRDLLRQITAGAASDPTERRRVLQQQRDEIDARIAALDAGMEPELDDTAVRERVSQVIDTSRALLRDMRDVEAGMRDLDRRVRTQATTWDGPRGELLASVFGTQAAIAQSDEGRSWQAFWEHLLSRTATDELTTMINSLSGIPSAADRVAEIRALLSTDLFNAAEATQRALASVSAQLRRFLDDKQWAEARRVDALIKEVLAAGLAAVQDSMPTAYGQATIDDLRLPLSLPTERPLYVPRSTAELDPEVPDLGAADDVDLTDLFEQSGIDVSALAATIDVVLAGNDDATLADVIDAHPLTAGLPELIGYLQALPATAHAQDGAREQVRWTTADGTERVATLPRIQLSAADTGDVRTENFDAPPDTTTPGPQEEI